MKAIIDGLLVLPHEIVTGKVLMYEKDIWKIVPRKEFRAGMCTDLVDANGGFVVPGFINEHIHGCAGADTMDESEDALKKMQDGGEIYFKTDDDDLFRDSLEYFPASGYDIEWMTFDLHENEPEWNIRTEHEGMFTEMGIKIKALIARKNPDPASVTWIEPKVLKRQAREAAEAEARAAQEGEDNE